MGGKPASTGPTKLNQISVQSSTLGVPLTIGWGRGRVKCNLIWYGGFQAIAHKSKQAGGKGLGGGGSTTDYSYTASVILALGEGQIGGINTIYRDKSTFTGASALADAGLSLANGARDQATWGYLASYFPSEALGYSGIAYVYAQDYALGDNATLPNHSFEVDFAVQLGSGVHDADPAAIVGDFLTNANAGLPGWPASIIGDLTDWSLHCRANNLLLSPVIDSQRQASDFLGEIMKATNSEVVWSEGLLKIASYGDTPATANGASWTPDLAPRYDLTEDDLIPDDGKPVKLEIVDQTDAYNMVQVEYLDRANQYNTAIAPAQDLANIVQYGRRKQDPTTLHSICDAAIAQNAAQLLLQRTLYMRETYSFTLPWNFARLEPMIDTVTLTTTTDELRLNRKQVRITGIEEDENGNLAVTAIGMDIGVASAARYNAHSASGYVPNLDVAPGSVSAPVLINAPTSLTGGAPEVWIATASTNPNWGGCEVWVSADGSEYQRIGAIAAPARIGVSTAALASHADPDTTNTLAVDLTSSLGALASATSPNANIGSTLCLIGSEIVSYQTATLTSACHYTLTGLRRGLYGTTIAAHASGAEFARLDDAIFRYAYGALALGSTMYVKLPSYNVFGRALEDIASVAAYTLQISPEVAVGTGSLGGFTLINRANCFVDGRTVTKITGSNSWGDGSVVSRESFIGGCFCGFQPVTTTAGLMVGLNSDPATDDGYASLDHAWYVDPTGAAYVFESGSPIAGPFAYAAGDLFMVRYDGVSVVYFQNGAVRHTTNGVGNMLQLYLDTAFANVGGKVTNLTYAGTGIPGTNGSDGTNGTNGTDGADGANAPLLEIEYSADGSSWHGTYAGADIYMRLSADGAVTWGSAQLIRGGDVTYAWVRSASMPAAPPSAPGSNTRPPAGWYAADPGGSGMLWMTFARFGGEGYNYTGWNPPVRVEGVDGTNGTDGHSAVIQGSIDGSSWHSGVTTGDRFIRVSNDSGATFGAPVVIKGDPGTDGIPGTDGSNGVSSYTHLAYATSADGSAGFSTSDPAGRNYLGIYVDSIAADSGDYHAYAWSLIKGADGANGANGTNGTNGANGLSIAITPGALTIPCASDGSPKSGVLPASAQMLLFEGASDVHASAGYAISTTNCTATVNSTGQVSITALSDDHALAIISATYGGVSLQQAISIAKARDGGTGGSGATPYIATLIGIIGTVPYTGAVVLTNGQTVTLNAIVNIFGSGGSPTVTLSLQYSLDGTSFSNMGGDYTDTETIPHNDIGGVGAAGTYTNSSGADQVVTFQAVLSNSTGTPSVQGGSYMRPTVS